MVIGKLLALSGGVMALILWMGEVIGVCCVFVNGGQSIIESDH